MGSNNKVVLKCENVFLDIPVVSKTELTFKKKFIRSITGGQVSSKKGNTTVKALSNLNLTIYSGQRIALIGHNGSGKSSFIRLISGIYTPTSGIFKSSTNVYPLLRKSFLVSPSLTGIDEAKAHYLLIKNNFKNFDLFLEDVKNFSGLGDFMSLPITTYSEGMAARLMFSLLTYHTHEFLALDEGIGTGDAAFYNKARSRLSEFIEKSGTLVFASHSKELLKKFCTRGLVFSEGTIVYDGQLEDAIEYYDSKHS